MLYEMTSGVLPFKRTTSFETADAILNSIPDALPAAVPVDLRRIIERCLAKDPDARFATAAELRDALDAVHVSSNQAPAHCGVRAWGTAVAALLVVAVAGALYSAQWPLTPMRRSPRWPFCRWKTAPETLDKRSLRMALPKP